MVKKIVCFLLVSFLLNSCGKVSFVKRTYNKGYYFSFNNHKKQTKHLIAKKRSDAPGEINQIKPATVQKHNPNASIEDGDEKLPAILKDENTELTIPKKGQIASSNTRNNVQRTAALNTIALGTEIYTAKVVFRPSGKRARKVLLAILCFFPLLSLIPVYLHDEKVVTMNFWFTLILHWTLLGYIIFALLVLFNVVDLR